jgi:hypothetical protein
MEIMLHKNILGNNSIKICKLLNKLTVYQRKELKDKNYEVEEWQKTEREKDCRGYRFSKLQELFIRCLHTESHI